MSRISARICKTIWARRVDAIRTEPGPLQKGLRLDRVALDIARAHFFGTGPAATVMNNTQAYLKTDPAEKMPDVQFLFRVAPLDAGPYLPPFKPAYLDGYGVRAVVLRPESRGQLSLASSRSACADPHRAEFLFARQGSESHSRRHAHGARGVRAIAAEAVRRQRKRAGQEKSSATPSSTPISAPPRPRSITRSAPARWAARATRARWSIPS